MAPPSEVYWKTKCNLFFGMGSIYRPCVFWVSWCNPSAVSTLPTSNGRSFRFALDPSGILKIPQIGLSGSIRNSQNRGWSPKSAFPWSLFEYHGAHQTNQPGHLQRGVENAAPQDAAQLLVTLHPGQEWHAPDPTSGFPPPPPEPHNPTTPTPHNSTTLQPQNDLGPNSVNLEHARSFQQRSQKRLATLNHGQSKHSDNLRLERDIRFHC